MDRGRFRPAAARAGARGPAREFVARIDSRPPGSQPSAVNRARFIHPIIHAEVIT